MEKNTAAAPPWVASIPLSPDGSRNAHVIVHPGRAVAPAEGLRSLLRFNADGQGGWISAAQAGDGRWGYIDAEGRWRVPPTLENARNYSEDGMARFLQDGRWGFVNLASEVVIAPSFEDTRAFRDGLCAVKVGENAWRSIDREGRFTSEQIFHDLSLFGAGGLARATHWDRKKNQRLQGFVDRDGRWVIEPRFDFVWPFGELPVTPASIEEDKWGLIDTRGQWVLEPRYPRIQAFNDAGLAYFDEPESWYNGHGYLDARGRVVVKGERHLSDRMVCGLAANTHNGTDFLRADGTALSTPALAWGSHFRAAGGCAVVLASPRRGDAGPGTWGMLHPDGRVFTVGEPLLEPLTDGDGWLVGEEPDTPLVPFLTRDGQVHFVDKEGALVWRAVYDGQQVALQQADGTPLWRSSNALDGCRPPGPFFTPPATDHLEGMVAPQEVTALAEDLLAEAEARLHRLAAGETLERESSPEHGARDDDDGDDDEYEDDDEDEATVQANRTVAVRRIARAYISEEHNGYYDYLGSELGDAVGQLRTALLDTLTARYGKPDADPECIVPWNRREQRSYAWAVPLAQALPGDSGVLRESREQWLTLYAHSDTGDGDAWWELWLMASPSLDALETARRAHDSAVAGTPGDEADASEGGTAAPRPAEPQTREEWLQAVADDHYAIYRVPAQWMDDAMADATLAHYVDNLSWLPAYLHTPARLEALIRRDVRTATAIPSECMTAEGLALARGLYAGDRDWDYRDERCSRLPTTWDKNSLYDVWGCLVTPEMALKAVRAEVPLRNVARWLRTDALEAAALKADIYNISYIDPAKITPELAERAVRHDYGCLIEHIPPALVTPELCLASARTNGLSLKKIPRPMRSVAVCVAALKESPSVFLEVPEAERVKVATRMIEDHLERLRKQGEPSQASHWHVTRAWAKLWAGDHEGAIADAQLGRSEVSNPENAHYVMASAHRALGHEREAALEASTVLSLYPQFQSEWGDHEDTRWLHALARGQASAADDATLMEQLGTHPRTLADIPRERITDAMVDVAMEADEDTVRFVPRRLMTPERYAAALRQGVKEFRQIPPAMLNEEACIEHVKDGGWRMDEVPEALRTLTVCAYAVRSRSGAMEHVPEALRDQVPGAIAQLPPEEKDDEDDGDGSSGSSSRHDWLTRKLADAMLGGSGSSGWKSKGLFMAMIVKAALISRSDDAPTLKGLAGWFEVRPVLSMVTNALLALSALIAHAFVSVGAWRAEGPWVGLGTFALMGFSELYWAWRFVFSTPFRPALGVACLVVVLYLFVWHRLYRKIGLAYAAQGKAENDD